MDLRIHNPEDIPGHLRPYITDAETTGLSFFHHPLLVTLMPAVLPFPIEEYLTKKREMLDRALNDGKYGSYVFYHERGYRIDALLELVEEGVFDTGTKGHILYWHLANDVWIDGEHLGRPDIWQSLIEVDLPYRKAMTASPDRKTLAAMQNPITVYRGVRAKAGGNPYEAVVSGWSWTLSRDKAEWFANRLKRSDEQSWVAELDIDKEEVLAYITGRNEEEIIIAPGERKKIAIEEV